MSDEIKIEVDSVTVDDVINLEATESQKKDAQELEELKKIVFESKKALEQAEARNRELYEFISQKNSSSSRRSRYDEEEEEEVDTRKSKKKETEEDDKKFKLFYEKRKIAEFLEEHRDKVEELRKIDPTFYESLEVVDKIDSMAAINLLKKRFKEVESIKAKKRPPAPPNGVSVPSQSGTAQSNVTTEEVLDGFTPPEKVNDLITSMVMKRVKN